MTTEEPTEYDLVVPFIACTSEGGPYDDEAFVVGFQAGQIYRSLGVLGAAGGTELQATVRSDLVKQLDLIAMHHGFQTETEACDGAEGWSFVTFRTADA